MNKGKKKNPFPEFLERIKGLLDKQKYKEVIDESNEFTRNNFITLKEEKQLEKLVKLAYGEQLQSLKDVDYSKFSREKLLKEIFKTNVVNIFAKMEFVERFNGKGTEQELDYVLKQLTNPNWKCFEVVNLLSMIMHCFPSYEGKVTFWDKNVHKSVVRSIKEFKDAKKARGFFNMVEKNVEEELFKEPSLAQLAKDLCKNIYYEVYGFPPKNVSAEEFAQQMVKNIRKLVNEEQM